MSALSASASKSHSKPSTRGSSHKAKDSEEADITVSRLQFVDRIMEGVRDAHSMEAGDGGDPLTDSLSNPAAQMKELLRACAQDHTLFKDLDHFYMIVLRNVVPANCDNQSIVSRYQSVVGAIGFVSRRLPVSALARLIDMDVEDIYAVLEKLQSVILLGDDNVSRIYHKSFLDYLMDQARCKDPCLRIEPRTSHTQIATHCFEIMNKHLKYNILGLGNMARYTSNGDGLKKDRITDEQLRAEIPQQLRYACIYWVDHLEVANIEDADLMNGLEKFVDEHTLHWFELLSLIGNLDSANHAIRIVMKLGMSTSSDLQQLLSDALHFISRFYELVKRSALHTYYSALPFSPTDSFLYRRYINEAEHDILCSIEGGLKKWDALVAKLSHGEGVDIIKFSFNSVLFVSCSKEYVGDAAHMKREGKLKIWDAATGIPISTIPGRRFAFTGDFSTIASSSDNVITYYNVDGSARGPMFTTSSTIEELAFSESSRIAAALSNGTVWLWESRNAKLIEHFDGFQRSKWSRFLFSPNGARLAYSSADGIVKLRDGISGGFIADLQCGSSRKFEFSVDSSRIASLSRECGLALWNSESGRLVGAIRDLGLDVDVLAISANGSLLATANRDKVTLWSENRDHLAKIKVLESSWTRSIAFSLEDILAVGTFPGIKLYNTNTHSFISTLPFGREPTALAFSPDCTHLACGSDYGDMYLWDMQAIDASSPPSQESPIKTVAVSRDCSQLACGFQNGILELWETSPTKRLIASHQHLLLSVVEFAPDGRLFASGSFDRNIKVWNGRDGSLHGTLKTSHEKLRVVALSNSVLVVAASGDFTLWNLDTLSHIHADTLKELGDIDMVAISDESDLVAVGFHYENVQLFDVVNHTTIATFTVPFTIYKLKFLPDKSHLVAQSYGGNFLSLNLTNKFNWMTNSRAQMFHEEEKETKKYTYARTSYPTP